MTSWNIVLILLVIVSIGLLATVIGLQMKLSKLTKRFEVALGGKQSSSRLESTLVNYFDKLNATESQLKQMRDQYQHLQVIGARSYQKTGLVRFNPFRDTGGDQSFALCLLDNQDSGVLLTAVHGREGTRMYAKPVEYGQSTAALSAEERQALQSAVSATVDKQPKPASRRKPNSKK